MLFWHLGAALWLFRWVFRDPKVDVRFLLLGAIIADLIDMPIGTILFADRYSTGELWSHTLIIPTVYMVAVVASTRRGRARRAWMALGIGWMIHILLDGMWFDQKVFLWPFFGWEMPSGQALYWPLAWERALSDPWRWVLETVGLSYLLWLAAHLGLFRADRRRSVLVTGRLPEHATDG